MEVRYNLPQANQLREGQNPREVQPWTTELLKVSKEKCSLEKGGTQIIAKRMERGTKQGFDCHGQKQKGCL